MYNDISIEDVKVYLISPNNFDNKNYQSLLLDFYYKWKNVWQRSYEKLGADPLKVKNLYSDRILIQDEIVILTYQDQIVSGASFKIFDLSNKLHLKQEYFADINDLTLHKLKNVSFNNKLLSCGDLTLVSKFCTKKSDFNWKYLMLAILFERSLRQANGPLVAYTNNTMNITKGCVDLGAKVIQKEFEHNLPYGANCLVDIIFVNEETMRNVSNDMLSFSNMAKELINRCQSNSKIELYDDLRKKVLTA